MRAAQAASQAEFWEGLLQESGRPELGERARLRNRLRAGLRITELVAGSLGGVVAALLIDATFVGSLVAITAFMLGWRFLGSIAGLCTDPDPRPWTSTMESAGTTLVVAIILSWLSLGALTILGIPNAVVASLVAPMLTAFVAINGRALVQSRVMRSGRTRQRTVIIGSGMVARQVVERLKHARHLGIETIGLVDDDVHHAASPQLPRIGRLADLDAILDRHEVDRVIVAFSRSSHDELLRCVRTCWDNGVAVDIVPRLFEFLDGARVIDQVGGLPMVSITLPQMSPFARSVKRVFDIVISATALVLLLPILVAIAVAIKLDSPGPVLFRQRRVGRGAREFSIWKYRSMYVNADERKQEYATLNDAPDGVMFKIRDDPRITRVGRFLRRTSLDELPQLFNVLRGEMSLVGPRPLIAEEIAAFSQGWHQRRLDLRPGLTGLWQIYGRSDIPYHDMLRFDYQYVAGWSLARDLRIMLATIPVLYSGRGAY